MRDEKHARSLAPILEANGVEEPEPGQFIGLQKCVRQELECPRVELDFANGSAASLSMLCLNESTLGVTLSNMTWDAHSGHLSPDEKIRLVGKVHKAMRSPAVVEFRERQARARQGSRWQKSG